MPIVSSVISSVAACLAISASHYGVSAERLSSVIAANEAAPSASRIGIAGVPVQWLPYLGRYGFNTKAVETDPCQNVAAAAWIMAYTDRLAAQQRAWSSPSYATRIKSGRAAPWQPTIQWIAQRVGLPAALINAVIDQESGFDPYIVSPAGAIGMMQIMPFNAKAWGIDPFNPAQNIWAGSWHLKYLIQEYRGDIGLALAAYNAGQNAVNKYGGIPPFKETMAYVPSVLGKYRQYASRQ